MVTMVRLNWRGLDCGNQTILGESLVKEADGGGGNTIQGLFSSDLHFLRVYIDVEDSMYGSKKSSSVLLPNVQKISEIVVPIIWSFNSLSWLPL